MIFFKAWIDNLNYFINQACHSPAIPAKFCNSCKIQQKPANPAKISCKYCNFLWLQEFMLYFSLMIEKIFHFFCQHLFIFKILILCFGFFGLFWMLLIVVFFQWFFYTNLVFSIHWVKYCEFFFQNFKLFMHICISKVDFKLKAIWITHNYDKNCIFFKLQDLQDTFVACLLST